MMTGRKRWWRAVALAAVGGGVIGGWFGLVRTQLAKADKSQGDETNWTRSNASAPPPAVAEVRAPEPAPQTGPVVQAGATLPIPNPKDTSPVAPAVPVTPPVLVPSAPLPVPPPGLPEVQPVAGPRVPDAGLVSGDRPAIPALPPAELPALPTPPKPPEVKPAVPPVDKTPKPSAPAGVVPPMPAVPAPVMPPAPLPMNTTEPPKAAPLPPPMPLAPPSGMAMPPVGPAPVMPPAPLLPPPTDLTPPPSPATPTDPVKPVTPAKPDSDLKPSDPQNTLKPTVPPVSPVAPAVPITPPSTGREAPGTPTELTKPGKTMDPDLGSTDKFVFPVPVKPVAPSPAAPTAPTPRDDTMSTLSTTAAFAVLGGALLAVEKASAFPHVPPPSTIVPAPGTLVKADDKMEIEKLRGDLKEANRKIEDLEKQVKRLTELLTGKREGGILVDPSAPGTVDDVKALKDKIAALEKQISDLKTQTSLKPTVTVPEAKPKGIVKVVNEYPVEISMVINEKSYRVAPNTKIEVEVPAGDFSYQLLQSGAAVTKSVIKDKETVTLRIK